MRVFSLAPTPLQVTFGKHIETKLTPALRTISVNFTNDYEQTDLVERAKKAQETLGEEHLQWQLTGKTRNYSVFFHLSQPLWDYLKTLPKRGVETGFHRLLSIRKNKIQTEKQLEDYLKPSHTASKLLTTIRTYLDKQG